MSNSTEESIEENKTFEKVSYHTFFKFLTKEV